MVNERKVVFGAEDIARIMLECRKCGCRHSLPLARFVGFPVRCPGCGADWVREAPAGLPASDEQRLAEAVGQTIEKLRQYAPHWNFVVLFEIDASD